LPTNSISNCPRANPIERAFGYAHDGRTCDHRRKRLPDLVTDMEQHLQIDGPWPYELSKIYYEPAVTAAVENIATEKQAKLAT